MKKASLLITIIALIIVLFCSCSEQIDSSYLDSKESSVLQKENKELNSINNNHNDISNESLEKPEIENKITKQIADKVYVDVIVNIPDTDKYDILNIEDNPFNVEDIKKVFFLNEEVNIEEVGKGKFISNPDVNSSKARISGNNMYYSRNSGNHFLINYVSKKSNLLSQFNQGENYYDLLTAKVLDFMEPIQSVKLVEENVKKISTLQMDIKNAQVLSVENNILKKIYSENDELFGGNWNGLYCLDINMSYNNIPVFGGEEIISFKSVPASVESTCAVVTPKVFATISKNGIEYLDIRQNFLVNSIHEQHNKVISVETALEKVKEKFDKIILENEIHINKISIMYFKMPESFKKNSENKYILKPVWVFEGEIPGYYKDKYYEDTESKTKYKLPFKYKAYWIFIDAITGEEIF